MAFRTGQIFKNNYIISISYFRYFYRGGARHLCNEFFHCFFHFHNFYDRRFYFNVSHFRFRRSIALAKVVSVSPPRSITRHRLQSLSNAPGISGKMFWFVWSGPFNRVGCQLSCIIIYNWCMAPNVRGTIFPSSLDTFSANDLRLTFAICK